MRPTYEVRCSYRLPSGKPYIHFRGSLAEAKRDLKWRKKAEFVCPRLRIAKAR